MKKWDCFGNLNENNINDDKTFGKIVKRFLLDKVTSANKMTLIDKKEILVGDHNTDKVLNTFLIFSVVLISQNIRTVNHLLTRSVMLFINVLLSVENVLLNIATIQKYSL